MPPLVVLYTFLNVPLGGGSSPSAQPLLQPLDLKGQVLTGDAMHTQIDLARFLVEEKQADYLFAVKDNQSTLKDDIQSLKLTDNSPP